MSIDAESNRLSQSEMLARLNRNIPVTEMVTVYWSDSTATHNHGIYCALIPASQIEKVIAQPGYHLVSY